jgi:hypothetical protein
MRGKYSQILAALKGTNSLLFITAVLIFIAAIAIASYRLKLIVGASGDTGITFLDSFSLTFIGYFFNNFLPTSIGGDVVKAYYLSKKSSNKMQSFTSVFIDRAIGLLTMIFIASIALLFVPARIIDAKVRVLIYMITLASLAFVIFMANKNIARKFSIFLFLVRPLEERLKKAYNAIHIYKHHTRLMLESVVISVISQLSFFVSYGVLALSIGSRIAPSELLLRIPLISAMSILPSINGLGLREGSTVLLFGPLIGKENACAVSILWLVILFMISIIGGLIYLLSPQFKIKFKKISEV